MTRRVVLVLVLLWAASAQAQTNQWLLQDPPDNANHWFPASIFNCTTKSPTRNNAPARAYSGSAMGGGKLMYFGGGHADYPGNDVPLFDTATGEWNPDPTQPQCRHFCCTGAGDDCDNDPVLCNTAYPGCKQGSCQMATGVGTQKPVYRCSGGDRDQLICASSADCTGGGACTIGQPTPGTVCASCRPYTEHTYQHTVWNPVRQKFLFIATHGQGTFEFDPATYDWEQLSTIAPPMSQNMGATFDQSNMTAWWRDDTDEVYYTVFSGNQRGVYKWSYATNTWSSNLNSNVPAGSLWVMHGASWSPRINQAILGIKFGDNDVRWYKYNPAVAGAAAFTSINANAPAALKAWCGGNPGRTRPCYTSSQIYDALNQRTIVMGMEGATDYRATLWAYDEVLDSWSQTTLSGTAPGGAALFPPSTGGAHDMGESGHLHYDDVTQALWFLDTQNQWQGGSGPGGATRLYRVNLDLGNPLPTNTPSLTFTPSNTPTVTPTRTPTRTPTNTAAPGTPTATSAPCPNGGIIRTVGVGKQYALPHLAALAVQAGDCIDIDAGTYENSLMFIPSTAPDVRVRGIGGYAKLTVTNGSMNGDDWGYPNDFDNKGIIYTEGARTTIENVEVSCATGRVRNPHCSGVLVQADPGSGIRFLAAGITLRNVRVHDNDDGLLGGPDKLLPPAGTVTIEDSEFYRNGLGQTAGLTHNIYLNGSNDQVFMRRNWLHGAVLGHETKIRARYAYIAYNRFTNEDNGYNSLIVDQDCDCSTADVSCVSQCQASVNLEFPCGGEDYVLGNLFEKAADSDARQTLRYASEIHVTFANGQARNCPDVPYLVQALTVASNTFVSRYTFGTAEFVSYSNSTTNGTVPVLKLFNNLMAGPGHATGYVWHANGTINQSNNVRLMTVASAQHLSDATFDYHLTTGSPAINAGFDPGTDTNGIALLPLQEYVYDRAVRDRIISGAPDVGAFEYDAAVVAFSTYTATPTNTPTPTVQWTNTPATPLYCGAGQTEQVYSIAKGEDDGNVSREGASYATLGNAKAYSYRYGGVTSDAGGANIDATRRHQTSGTAYRVGQALMRWNTSLRPDGTSWPNGTEIVGAFLRPMWSTTGAGPRTLVLEWYTWPAAGAEISNADWALGSPSVSDPTYAAEFVREPTTGRQTIALSNAATNINLADYSALRLTVRNQTPPVAEDTNKALRPWEYLTAASGDVSAQLVLCSQIAAGMPTDTPTQTPTVTQTPSATPTEDSCVCEAGGQCLCFSSTPQEQCVCFRRMEGTPGP